MDAYFHIPFSYTLLPVDIGYFKTKFLPTFNHGDLPLFRGFPIFWSNLKYKLVYEHFKHFLTYANTLKT